MLICTSRKIVVFAVIALHTLLFADQIYAAPKASRFTVGVGLASDGFGQGTSSTTSEHNLIGIDDNFYQFSVGCSHHF